MDESKARLSLHHSDGPCSLTSPVRGRRFGNAKLTEETVRYIRANAGHRFGGKPQPGKKTQKALAVELGVNQALVSMVLNRKVWAHLT